MKKIRTMLLLFASIYSIAEIKIETTSSMRGKDKEVCVGACKRVGAFYNWYIGYLGKNKIAPLQHAVYDQYITGQLRDKILSKKESDEDIFFGQKDVDVQSDLVLSPVQFADNKIYVLLQVKGKYNYTLKLEMIVQKDNWCINDVTRA